MASSKTRKPPNAFNFLRQNDVLKKAGLDAGFDAPWPVTIGLSAAPTVPVASHEHFSHYKTKPSKFTITSLPRTGPMRPKSSVRLKLAQQRPEQCPTCNIELLQRSWRNSKRL